MPRHYILISRLMLHNSRQVWLAIMHLNCGRWCHYELAKGNLQGSHFSPGRGIGSPWRVVVLQPGFSLILLALPSGIFPLLCHVYKPQCILMPGARDSQFQDPSEIFSFPGQAPPPPQKKINKPNHSGSWSFGSVSFKSAVYMIMTSLSPNRIQLILFFSMLSASKAPVLARHHLGATVSLLQNM